MPLCPHSVGRSGTFRPKRQNFGAVSAISAGTLFDFRGEAIVCSCRMIYLVFLHLAVMKTGIRKY